MSDPTHDTESTSAALARVTAERDRFIAAADKLHGEWLDLKAEVERLVSLGSRTMAERDYALNLAEALRRTIAELTEERGAAQLERDHARSERDALKALYADAAKRLGAGTGEAVAVPGLISSYPSWQCLDCGHRSTHPRPHGHSAFCNQPLTPVHITITHREGHR